MSVASILKTDLSSLAIRLVTVDSDDGIRTIEGIEPIAIPDNSEGILGIIGKAILNAGGWLFGVGSWAVSGLASLCVSVFIGSINYLINFNWNATDEELVQQLLSSTGMIGSQIGGAIGNFAGFLFFGSIGSLVAYRFNPLLRVKVLWDEGEEALDELCSNVSTITRNIALFLIQAQVVAAFAAIRWVLKTVLANPNSPLAAWGTKIFGSGFTKAVKNWGEKGSKPWSFAKKTEDFLNTLPNWLQDPIEEFMEEFWDAGQEALYIAAGDIDEYIAEQQIERTIRNGPFEAVEVMPNREDKELKLIFEGPQELLKPAIVQTLATHQMLEDYDIGLLVGGEPIANTITQPGLPYARLIFSSSKAKKTQQTYIEIHNIDRTKWDNWEKIKLACGGENGYWWGPYLVEVALTDNNIIRCFSRSEDEGIDFLEGLIQFSKAEQDEDKLLWQSRHEIKKGTRKKYNDTYKTPRQQFPWEFVIVNQMAVLNEGNGKSTHSGIYTTKQAVIPLWTEKKPDDFAERIQELFTTPGPNG